MKDVGHAMAALLIQVETRINTRAGSGIFPAPQIISKTMSIVRIITTRVNRRTRRA
jgi:hypothetical protein